MSKQLVVLMGALLFSSVLPAQEAMGYMHEEEYMHEDPLAFGIQVSPFGGYYRGSPYYYGGYSCPPGYSYYYDPVYGPGCYSYGYSYGPRYRGGYYYGPYYRGYRGRGYWRGGRHRH